MISVEKEHRSNRFGNLPIIDGKTKKEVIERCSDRSYAPFSPSSPLSEFSYGDVGYIFGQFFQDDCLKLNNGIKGPSFIAGMDAVFLAFTKNHEGLMRKLKSLHPKDKKSFTKIWRKYSNKNAPVYFDELPHEQEQLNFCLTEVTAEHLRLHAQDDSKAALDRLDGVSKGAMATLEALNAFWKILYPPPEPKTKS